jgi:hypothetical protein
VTAAEDVRVNVEHMELLAHLITSKELFTLSADAGSATQPVALQTVFDTPYLLYEALAFSARHLAAIHSYSPGVVDKKRSTRFSHLAMTLQTRALSLYNAARPSQTVDESNCVALLLFAATLGHHLLTDTLALREGGLDGFLVRYLQCIELQRGIRLLVNEAKPLLEQTWLGAVVTWSAEFSNRTPYGTDCQALTALLAAATRLSEAERRACQQAARYLQVGFDAVSLGAELDAQSHAGVPVDEEAREPGKRFHMVLAWTILAPKEFTDLLAAHRPEALVILAYYAILLHHARAMWQVGNAGMYLLDLIVDFLGPTWHRWLEYPRQVMAI